MTGDSSDIVIAALYKFIPIPGCAAVQGPLREACLAGGVMGTILLAHEGINGTIAGARAGIDRVLDHIRSLPGCMDLEHKESCAPHNPFYRMKVRLKNEIVTMGMPGVDASRNAGAYVEPADWDALISDPDVLVIDTRNDYEVSIGTFKGAINPRTTSFRDFPDWFRENRDHHDKPKVAMFCTGGIRSEKATAFLKQEGVDEVFHLKGGILKYLESASSSADPADSKWQGECFVFDQRVSVGQGLVPGSCDLCHACRHPVDAAGKASDLYVPGVSCPRCYNEKSPEQRKRFKERQRQIELARARGEQHLGQNAQPAGSKAALLAEKP